MSKNRFNFPRRLQSSEDHSQHRLLPSSIHLKGLVENTSILFSILVIQIDESQPTNIKAILVECLLEEVGQRVLSFASNKRVKAHIFEDHADVLVLVMVVLCNHLLLDWVILTVGLLVGVEGKEGWATAEELPRFLHAGWYGIILFCEISKESDLTEGRGRRNLQV